MIPVRIAICLIFDLSLKGKQIDVAIKYKLNLQEKHLLFDDKVVLTFNYSGDNRTITLHEIDGGLGHSICIPSAVVYHEKTPLLWHWSFFMPRGTHVLSRLTHKNTG